MRLAEKRGTVMEKRNLPVAGEFYRHFKGNLYQIIGVAKHSETLEPMVVYRALYGDGGVWMRPAEMWNETIERDGKNFLRFERILP
jgi:hypothetical protein